MRIFELLFKDLFNVHEKKSSDNPFALKGDVRPYRRAMIKNIKIFFKQEKYKGMFKKAFFSRVAKGFMKTGRYPAVTEEDINEGVSIRLACSVFNRAMRICSLRSIQEENIKRMRSAEVKRIVMKVSRVGTGEDKLDCPKAPKEKKFLRFFHIPLYPCYDCECDPMCDIWYKAEF